MKCNAIVFDQEGLRRQIVSLHQLGHSPGLSCVSLLPVERDFHAPASRIPINPTGERRDGGSHRTFVVDGPFPLEAQLDVTLAPSPRNGAVFAQVAGPRPRYFTAIPFELQSTVIRSIITREPYLPCPAGVRAIFHRQRGRVGDADVGEIRLLALITPQCHASSQILALQSLHD